MSEIYPRVTSLLAPNGILLVEDVDIVGDLDELTPGMQRCMHNFHKYMISNGQDPAIARYIAGNMIDLGVYDKMRVDNCELPLNPSPETGKNIAWFSGKMPCFNVVSFLLMILSVCMRWVRCP